MTQILLATYNGEKYLPELLRSLSAQTDPNWTLLIRDDNSTDKTPQIISEFETQHPGKVQVVHDHGKEPNDNLGPKDNFGRLLHLSSDQYVMFCDQDDIWRPHKIEESLKVMHELEARHGKRTPLLVHSDTSLCNAEGTIIEDSYNARFNVRKEKTELGRLMVETPITGLTMMMNRPLVERVGTVPPVAEMHDAWVGRVAALTGQIGYIEEPLAARRVHENNVTGISKRLSKPSWANRTKGFLQDGLPARVHDKVDNHEKIACESATVAQELLQRYGNEIDDDKKALLRNCAELPEQWWLKQKLTMVRHSLMPMGGRKKIERVMFTPSGRKSEENAPDMEPHHHPSR